MFDWFHKMLPKNTFYVLLNILHIEKKKTHNICIRMLEHPSPRGDVTE